MPTILHLLNQNKPSWCEGEVLPSLGGNMDQQRSIFAMDGKKNHRLKPLTRATFSIIRWPYKLINYRGYAGYEDIDELYHLENDPDELNNLLKSKPDIVF